MTKRSVAFALVLAGVPALLPAQSLDTLFARANESYRQGQYAAAAAGYRSILDRGRCSAELYFNLGNAEYRRGALSKAVLAYERAIRLEPFDKDILHNLQLTRLRALDRIDPVPEFFLVTWLRSVSSVIPPVIARRIFLGFWMILFASLAAMFLVRSAAVVRAGRIVFFTSSTIAVLCGALFLVQVLVLQEEDTAIITAATVTVKSSPDPQSSDAFVIHEGLKVRMSDAVAEWVKITLADGKVGWVRATECEKI